MSKPRRHDNPLSTIGLVVLAFFMALSFSCVTCPHPDLRHNGITLANAGAVHTMASPIILTERNVDTMLALTTRMGQVRSYLTHNQPSLTNEIGYFFNFRKHGVALVADFVFYDSFAKNRPREFDKLQEMIEETPSLLAISVRCGILKVANSTSGATEMMVLRVASFDWVGEGAFTDRLFK